MRKTFKSVVRSGEVLGFYGVDGYDFKLGKTIFQAIEDEDDGYRSMLDEVESVDRKPEHVFFGRALDRVRVESVKHSENWIDFSGYRIVSVVDGHVWLEIGTGYYDYYYPCFVFDYHPKEA